MTIRLNGSDLTVTQVVAVARHGEAVTLAPEAIAGMRRARLVVQDVLAAGEAVYGLTTGVGERKACLLDPAGRQRFNQRLVLNHRIAQGDVAPPDVVRGAMVCLANSYAKGVTGVRPELAEMILTLLNEGFTPPVRRLGSVGAGDLGPMADLAYGLITRSGFEVAENEGLALVSSNAFTTAWACLAVADAQAMMDVFDVAPLSARRLADMVLLCARVAAIEFVVAAQAIDLRAPGELGLGSGRAYRMIRELIPFMQADGTLPADLEPVVELVTRGVLNQPTPAA